MISFLLQIHEEQQGDILEAIDAMIAQFADNNLPIPRAIEVGYEQYKDLLAKMRTHQYVQNPGSQEIRFNSAHGTVGIIRVNERSVLRAVR